MREEQWITVTPTDYEHEATAFRQLAAALPDDEVYWVWSNFMFVAGHGHLSEVDALVLGPAGFYLVEVKSWTARLTLSSRRRRWHYAGKEVDDEYERVEMKAKRFAGLLTSLARKHRIQRPFVEAIVYFSDPRLEVRLPPDKKKGLYGRPRGLPDVVDVLTAPPRGNGPGIDAHDAKKLVDLLQEIGLNESHRYRQAGTWLLEPEPFADSQTWQDYLATHQHVRTQRRRVRLYLVERQSSVEHRERVARAARRELTALEGIDHPGIVRVDNLEEHPAGSALVYRYDPRSVRLLDYLAEYGDRLSADARVGLVRQVAEALAYAHGQRLYHQGLSARCVLVTPAGGRHSDLTDDQRWLNPRLVIIDWGLASRHKLLPDDVSVHGTRHDTFLQNDLSDGYLAPEWRQRGADSIALDVFGAGAIAYTILTDEEPAVNELELSRKLTANRGLCPSAVRSGLPEGADALVGAATAGRPAARLASMDAFLDLLNDFGRELKNGKRSAPARPSSGDPLDAGSGDRLQEWTIEERLGTGSTARAFLARHASGTRHVLKVALTHDKAKLLDQELAVLRRLRNDSSVIQLAMPEVVDLASRPALVFEYISRDTLARVLRHHGRLGPGELEAFGDQLFHVVGFLEREGVHHRDIKPDNIVIRTAPSGIRTPVLFDFSLSRVPPHDLRAGTDGYLDPFLGLNNRLNYDNAAERYALAVTLHQMASTQLPVWGDGGTVPIFIETPATVAAEAFEPALRTPLEKFFAQALAPAVSDRFGSLKEMRLAWTDVFRVRADPAPARHAPTASKSVGSAKPSTRPATVPKISAAKTDSSKSSLPKTAPAPKKATGKAKSVVAPTGAALPNDVEIRQIRQAVREALKVRPRLPLATVGEIVKKVAPRIHEKNYPGSGSLTNLLAKHFPEFRHIPGVGGGELELVAPKKPTTTASKSPVAPVKVPAPAKPAKAPVVTPPTDKEIAGIRDALWAAFETQDRLNMGMVGQIARKAAPRMREPSWGGPKNLTRFLELYLPEFSVTPGAGGGIIRRPGRSRSRSMLAGLVEKLRSPFTVSDQ